MELSVANPSTVLKSLGRAGIEYSDIDIIKPTLEDAFTHLAVEEQTS